jgi:hypothetical protein
MKGAIGKLSFISILNFYKSEKTFLSFLDDKTL